MAVGSKDLAAPKLRGMEDDELVNQLRSAKEELFNLRFRPRPGSWRTTAGPRAVRRTSPASTPRCASELGIVTTESETAGDNSASDIAQPARGFRKSRKASSSATRWTRPLSSPSRTA